MGTTCERAAQPCHDGAAIVGRDHELSTVSEALDAPWSRLVIVTGTHGSGRTTLADEVTRMSRDRGHLTLCATTTPEQATLPLTTLRVLLRSAAAPGLCARATTRIVTASDRLTDAVRRPGTTDVQPAVTAIVDTILELADEDHVSIVIDGGHLADPLSIAGIASVFHLARVDTHLKLIVTAPSGRQCPLVTAVLRSQMADPPVVVELGDLDLVRADRLAAAVADRPLTDHEREHIWTSARGHPAWTVELARQVADGSSPSTWVRGLATHLQRIAPGALDVAETLALDERWPLWLLAGVAHAAATDADRSAEAVDALVADGWLVVEDETIRFRHPVMREHLAALTGPATRRNRHRRIVEHLRTRASSDPSTVVALAPHLEAGLGPGDDAALALIEAADASLSIDLARAQRWYEDARALLSADHPRHGHLLAQLFRCHRATGDIDQAIALGSSNLTDHRLDPQVGLDVIELIVETGPPHRSVALLDRFERYAGSSADSTIVRAKLLCEEDRFDEARELIGSTRPGELTAHQQARSLEVLATILHRLGRICERDAVLEQIVARTAHVPSHLRAGLLRRVAAHLAWTGSFAAAREVLDESETVSEADVFGTSSGLGAVADGLLSYASGDWDRLLGLVEQDRSTTLCSRDRALLDALALEVHTARGDFDSGDQICRRLEASIATPLLADVAIVHHRWSRGDDGLHRRLHGRCEERWAGGRFAGLPFAVLRLTEQLVEIGDHDAARRWGQRLDRFMAHDGFPLLRACTARVTSLTTTTPDAARGAHAVCEQLGYRLEASRSLLEVGERDRDSEILRAAHDEFAILGATPLRRRAARALRDLGAAAPRRPVLASSDLTDTERELISHVCSGLTNRQIASAMTLRPKTIETYLTRLYAKVGAASRVELIVRVQGSDPTWR